MMDIDTIFEKGSYEGRESLIPVLQQVQEEYGYISKEAVRRIGGILDLPASKIYGVATFYNQFRFEPLGKHHILLCRGTACHVKQSAALLEAVTKSLGIVAGKRTRDGLFSLEVVACMGACGLAPVVCIDGEFFAKMTPKKLLTLLETYRNKEAKSATV